MSEDSLDAMAAGELVGNMWKQLGEQIMSAIPGIVKDDPEKAIRYATCAEACFWKATGDADTHDVKDVLVSSCTSAQLSTKGD